MTKTRSDATQPAPKSRFEDEYVVDPVSVAEALLKRIDAMADERARFRRSLIYSVEMIEAPDFEIRAGRVEQPR